MNNLEIIELRKKFNLTQDELANLVGVSRRTIINWEDGKTIPKAMQNILETIAQKESVEIGSQRRKNQIEDGVFLPQNIVELILSQQRTIENLSKKSTVRVVEDAKCADAAG